MVYFNENQNFGYQLYCNTNYSIAIQIQLYYYTNLSITIQMSHASGHAVAASCFLVFGISGYISGCYLFYSIYIPKCMNTAGDSAEAPA